MVSIIIPVKEINNYIREAMAYYQKLDYCDYEILIFPDEETEECFPNTQIIPSGPTGPAEKRDMALKYAKGDIIAFIDDDAYPREDWLKNAVRHFDDSEIGAVGGPAVTAPNDNDRQKASGKTYESFLCSGGYTYRYIPGTKEKFVEDLPSVNLIVRREVFEEVGGFDSNFYPGEDTKLCLDILQKAKKKILYDPEILVYHHRRKVFGEHLKQVTNYAKHRGYFAKKLPETSLKLAYFIPSLFTLGLVAGPVLSAFFPVLWYVYGIIIGIYVILVLVSIRKAENIKIWGLAAIGIFLTHIGYGICFIRGLCSKKLLR